MNKEEYNKNRPRKICPLCGKGFTAACFERHYKSCLSGRTYISVKHTVDSFICGYCGKQLHNLNSLVQHEVRCPQNPDRKAYTNLVSFVHTHLKGHTKETSEVIMKQSMTMKKLYAEGSISRKLGKVSEATSVYEAHNDDEIARYKQYISTLDVSYKVSTDVHLHPDGYKYSNVSIIGTQVYRKYPLEHMYLASLILGRDLQKGEVVHHLDKNKLNNSLDNLIVFKSISAHLRFHYSSISYLIYDDKTHLFDCIKVPKLTEITGSSPIIPTIEDKLI